MSQKYKANEKQDSRLFKPGILFAIVLFVGFGAGLTMILLDILASPNTIDESANQAVLGEFRSNLSQFKDVETANYQLEIPEDWVQINNPEIILDGTHYYPERFQGVTGANVGRKIDVYRDDIPNIPVERIYSVSPEGSRISVGTLSPQCSNFTKNPRDFIDAVPSEWRGIEFKCTLSQSRNNVGTAITSIKDGVSLTGKKSGTVNYLLVYTDHGSNLNNDIFAQILRSFQVK